MGELVSSRTACARISGARLGSLLTRSMMFFCARSLQNSLCALERSAATTSSVLPDLFASSIRSRMSVAFVVVAPGTPTDSCSGITAFRTVEDSQVLVVLEGGTCLLYLVVALLERLDVVDF